MSQDIRYMKTEEVGGKSVALFLPSLALYICVTEQ
jgi:hypothetical protein